MRSSERVFSACGAENAAEFLVLVFPSAPITRPSTAGASSPLGLRKHRTRSDPSRRALFQLAATFRIEIDTTQADALPTNFTCLSVSGAGAGKDILESFAEFSGR
jgi:hypothetical protein